jgi:hypothetical protein
MSHVPEMPFGGLVAIDEVEECKVKRRFREYVTRRCEERESIDR